MDEAQRWTYLMAGKCALIVDDSRTARQFLGRVLEDHGIRVETAESAEAALEFLAQHRPDVIFMDHMMPGMDGFQAVHAIKSNPATATIPIMMYTSQQGELYVGQARALGAVGVLPKQIRPVEVSEVLRSLRLIPTVTQPGDADRQDAVAGVTPPSATPVDSEPAFSEVGSVLEPANWSELHGWLEEMLVHYTGALRSDIERSVRGLLDERLHTPELQQLSGPQKAGRAGGRLQTAVTAILVGVLAGLAGLFYWLHLDTQEKWQTLSAQNASLLATLDTRRLNAARQAENSDAAAESRADEAARYTDLISALEWTANQSATYPAGQTPLGDERLELVSGLVQRLRAAGFGGTVRLKSYVGDFCAKGGSDDEMRPAPAELPADQCDRLGLSAAEARDLASQESVAFANYVASLNNNPESTIRIEIVPMGNASPLFSYPPSTQGVTAGEWNRVARRNNRIEIQLIPAAGAS